MKYQFLILGVLIISNFASSQTLVDTSKQWSNIIKGPPYNPMPTEHTETIKFGQDTLIDSKSYKEVLRSTDEHLTNWNVYCYIRENLDSVVYIRTDTSASEYILYDFGALTGDSIAVTGIESYIYSWSFVTNIAVVDSIDNVFFSGENRKRINLSTQNMAEMKWIDGIGSLEGILHNNFLIVGGDWFELVCYSENDTLKYFNPGYSSCFNDNTSIEANLNKHMFSIFPNPFQKMVSVSIYGNAKFEIYNTSGILIYKKIITGAQELDLSYLKSGFYYYKVQIEEELIETGKLIKK